MISAYLLSNYLFILIAILAFFIFIKVIILFYHGVSNERLPVFFQSLVLISRQAIRNTDSRSLKGYYKASNSINKVFYIVILLFSIFCGFVFLIKS